MSRVLFSHGEAFDIQSVVNFRGLYKLDADLRLAFVAKRVADQVAAGRSSTSLYTLLLALGMRVVWDGED